ncbi:hypothetical protein DFR49_3737 [Hephaestia caeni]|uniref:Uncharacterized protein n=1 Tax=Hephaestia caeni TaxID=645617 RepID=A0A397NN74_9SPHN|nr:DciA family protein [Hephaestia caeni]RIA37848.1 hypothetical protein DFR49_3737 [Hephaestia caeni]
MSKTRRGLPRQTNAEPRRSNRSRAVSELLPDVGRAAFRKFGFIQSAIVSRWAEIVGARYAGVSAPESLRFPHGERSGGTLTLVVRGAHAPMMQHITPEIVERVNRFFGYGAVARVTIRQGEVAVAKARVAPPSLKAPSLKPATLDLGDSLRSIADPELKAVLESLAAGVASTHGPPVFDKD